MNPEWRKKVYRKAKIMTREERDEWRKTRAAVLDRDIFTCQRCSKKSGNGRALTVHHITPRVDGGSNDLSNLITLCTRCHDAVEVAGHRLRADICSMDSDPIVEPESKPGIGGNEGFVRPSWHKYVYGGQKRS